MKYSHRKIKNKFMKLVLVLLTALAIIPLAIIFFHVVKSGFSALSYDFLTSLPAPVGQPGGGIANAILGSLTMIALASLIGVPIGVFGGTYLSEYPNGKLSSTLRFVVDLMTSIPSIVIGLYVYSMIVVPMKGFSAYAGALALALLMFPIVVKSTEEVLRLLPQNIREAGLALGIPRWRVILSIILKGSIPSITTGVLLSIARVSGETAPLLLTAFGNQYWAEGLNQPTASLTVQIYNYAISPFQEWHKQAWAGAFILLLTVFIFNLMARWIIVRNQKDSR
jgi:phosphate transport system permease protein